MSDTDAKVAAILRGKRGAGVGAFFDFDGTLIDGYSATAFLRGGGVGPARLLGAALGAGPLPLLRAAASLPCAEPGDGDVDFAYAVALRAMRGMSEAELAASSERVFLERIAARLRPEMWSLVQAHRRMGHRVVIVSAATRWQIGPTAARLGVEDVLCSDPEVEHGRVRVLRGVAKAAAVLEFADAHGIDLAASHAYGNAGDDAAFLAACGNPCAVCPGRALAGQARTRGWEILRLPGAGRRGPVTALRSLAAWQGALTGLATGIGLGTVGFDRRFAAELGMELAGRACLEIAGVRVRVQGAENLGVRPAVFLFNHQSWLDVVVMSRLLRHDYTGFAKRELARVPGLGGLGRALEVVFLDRGTAQAGADGLTAMLDLVARGVSVAVAPEGTRSSTPMPGPFRKGAFLAARKAGVPVVPVVIRNTGRLAGRTGKAVRAGQIDVFIYPPLDVSEWRVAEFGARIEELRRLYIDTLTTGRVSEAVGALR